MLTQRQRIGRHAEDLAAEFLRRHGCEILLRNFRRRLGELDLVARDGGVLVIAEVRTRARGRFGSAAESVDWRKRRSITRTAMQLLQQRADLARLPVRFDVIAVHELASPEPRIEWIRHAFEAARV